MTKRDYYDVLGVAKNASDAEIKQTYRKLAMKHHPDRNPGNKEAETKFKEATEAYENLKDGDKRAAYDRYGHQDPRMGGGSQSSQGFDFNDIFSNFNDIFGDSGGGRAKKKSSAIRGSDIRYNLEISLQQAFNGITEQVSFTIPATCGSCGGSGAKGNEKPINCNGCNGSGKVRAQQGFFIVERTCGSCGGSGQKIKNPCQTCSGEGRVSKNKTLAVKIPAGVEDGNRVRVTGEGEAGVRGGESGDLYVFITIKKHQFFERKGNDISCEVPIKFTTAALGGSIEIPTIDGVMTRLQIVEGTQNNDQFRLKTKGMTVVNSGGRRGDMYVKVFVETPVKLSSEEKELLQRLDKLLENKANHPHSESFFKKVSGFFK